MSRIAFIDEHAARPVFARRNPIRSRILRHVAEIEQVLRLGFDLKGRPHRLDEDQQARLAAVYEGMRLHLATNPELQQ